MPGFRAAANRARQTSNAKGGAPFVVVAKISTAEYNELRELDLYNPFNEQLFNALVYESRYATPEPSIKYNVVRGPVATRNSRGQFVADGSFPAQYRFDEVGAAKLQPVGLVPVN